MQAHGIFTGRQCNNPQMILWSMQDLAQALLATAAVPDAIFLFIRHVAQEQKQYDP